MRSNHLLHETPRDRLLRLETGNPPLEALTSRAPIYLTAVGLLLLMCTMIAVGVLVWDFAAAYARLIENMASPFWR